MKAFFHKIKEWFVNHRPSKRRLIQLYAALLYNANIKGFVSGSIYTGNTKYLCVPGLNCYSCPGAIGACPLGALQNALAASNTKAPFYVFGIIILFGLLLGRVICGFLCPIGLIQELLYKIKSPKVKKNRVTRVLSYFKYILLAVLVIIIPLAYSGISSAIPAFCKYICPSGTLLGSVSLLANGNNDDFFSMLGPLFTWKFCVLVLIIVGSIFIYRIFCRFLCPLGAIYGFFCRIAMLGIKLDKQKCVDCGLCIQTCKMDIRHVGDHECIHCGDCLKVCPTKAISWKGSKIFLHANAIEEGGDSAAGEKVSLNALVSSSAKNGGTLKLDAQGASCANIATAQNVTAEALSTPRAFEETSRDRRLNGAEAVESEINAPVNKDVGAEQKTLEKAQKRAERKACRGTAEYVKKRNFILETAAWAVALVFLLSVLVYYNVFHKETVASVSYEIGDTVESFTMKKYFGDGDATYTLQDDLDDGKIIVLNFWYIGCQPCQEELPDFGELAAEYPDDISLVVIHSSTVNTNLTAALENYVKNYMGWEFWAYNNVSFTLDNSDDDSMYYAFNGKNTYPMTVVLDREGVVCYRYADKVSESFFDDVKSLLEE